LPAYISELAQGQRPTRELEPLSPEVRMRERVMLGLRLDEPLGVDGLGDVLDEPALARLERLGLVACSNGSLALTARGRMLGGGVTADLLA
jgi:coproporphyrinogen III oxidase-like Fe-S oxidoreductase